MPKSKYAYLRPSVDAKIFVSFCPWQLVERDDQPKKKKKDKKQTNHGEVEKTNSICLNQRKENFAVAVTFLSRMRASYCIFGFFHS